jgi:hypothetical protein
VPKGFTSDPNPGEYVGYRRQFSLGSWVSSATGTGGVENNTSLLVMMLKNEDAGEGRRKDRDRKEKLRAR